MYVRHNTRLEPGILRGKRAAQNPQPTHVLKGFLCPHGAGARCWFLGNMADLVLVPSWCCSGEKKRLAGVALSSWSGGPGKPGKKEDARSGWNVAEGERAAHNADCTGVLSVCAPSGGNGFSADRGATGRRFTREGSPVEGSFFRLLGREGHVALPQAKWFWRCSFSKLRCPIRMLVRSSSLVRRGVDRGSFREEFVRPGRVRVC
jgi:hypothetical protein